VDALFNAAQLITMIDPSTQAAIAITQTGFNLLKSGAKSYISYLANQERKRSERIGDVDIDILKDQGMVEKSETEGYPAALKIYLEIKKLENETPTNVNEINDKKRELENMLVELNKSKINEKQKITTENFDLFLDYEKEAIKNIATEVKKDEYYKKYWASFMLQNKDKIIRKDEFDNLFDANGDIKLENILKLDPADQDYFFEKTQIAIRTASNRKRFSSKERLDMMEKILLTKADDSAITKFMIDKYKDKDVYNNTDDPKIQFTKSVIKFKKEMEIV
jgi:predicted transcriptional regulator